MFIDFSKNHLITKITFGDPSRNYSHPTLYLHCNKGDEKALYDSLPLCLKEYGEVVKTYLAVFITFNKNLKK